MKITYVKSFSATRTSRFTAAIATLCCERFPAARAPKRSPPCGGWRRVRRYFAKSSREMRRKFSGFESRTERLACPFGWMTSLPGRVREPGQRAGGTHCSTSKTFVARGTPHHVPAAEIHARNQDASHVISPMHRTIGKPERLPERHHPRWTI